MSRSSYWILALWIVLLFYAEAQKSQFSLTTSPIIVQGQPISIPVCFGDCTSCQQSNGNCQTCFQPWFDTISGQCQITGSPDRPLYILESTPEQKRSTDFIPSTAWISNSLTLTPFVCQADSVNFNRNFSIGGFFRSQILRYRRTISQHDYLGVKFLLLLFNWNQDSSLQINITNEDNQVLAETVIRGSDPRILIANENAQCDSKKYKKISIMLEMFERNSRQIQMVITPNISGNQAQWSFTSFVLVSGKCNETCATCSEYSPSSRYCLLCTNFRANSENQSCSTCVAGFRSIDIGCEKCQIPFQNCQVNSLACNYPNLTSLAQNCSFAANTFVKDQIFAPTKTFFSTLFKILGEGATIARCGEYSVIGPANLGQIITRSFVTLPPHVALSINFNIFIFDQESANERYTIVILVDGKRVSLDPELENININGFSNECGAFQKVEAMKSFETTKFIKHTKTDNVDIGISLGSSKPGRWGIRDVRLVYQRCDANCLLCGETGCLQCKGLLQLVDGECSGCPGGSGLNLTNPDQCQPCIANCLECGLNNANQFKCSKCMDGFYLYEINSVQSCVRNPNFGAPVTGGQTAGGNVISNSSCSQIFSAPPAVTNTTNGSAAAPPSRQIYKFQIAEDKLIKTFNLKTHYKYTASFYVLKIDDWQGDYLDIYINDLLVSHQEYGSAGSKICEKSNENQQITFEQFTLNDDNNTVSIQFEVVHKDPNNRKPRKFGVSDFKIIPVGCPQCENYKFFYRTQYTTDSKLNVEVAFNLIYENKDPEDFKNIFRLNVSGKPVPYQIVSNDSIRYWLAADLPKGQKELIKEKIVLECLYPERVVGRIPSNQQQGDDSKFNTIFQRRNLQQLTLVGQSPTNYNEAKRLDQNKAQSTVERYTPLGDMRPGILGLKTFFQVLTRIVIYVGFASFFVGCQTPFTHLMHNFQKIWVHIYVATLTMNSALKTTLVGFRECQDQNIAINPRQWQAGIPRYLFYDAPAQYQQYYHDITFFRNIYNVGFAFAILLVFFLVMHLFFRKRQVLRGEGSSFSQIFKRHMKVTFHHRPVFYFNSIIFYQYFTVMLACCLQFIDLTTNTYGYQTFARVNAVACIIAFVFATLYPIIFHFFLWRKRQQTYEIIRGIKNAQRNQMQDKLQREALQLEQSNIIFNNKYHQIFFRFLPNNLWNMDLSTINIINENQSFYNIIRFGELWWYSFVVCLIHYSPFAQAFLLMLTNAAHILLLIVFNNSTTRTFKYLKIFELLFFLGLEILILVMFALSDTLRPEAYNALGIVGIVFIFIIITLSIIRTWYTLRRIWREYRYPGQLDDRTPSPAIRFPFGFLRGWTKQAAVSSYQIP